MRRATSMAAAAGLLAFGWQFGASAAWAACDGSSDPCSIDLGRATAHFSTGAASYFAEMLPVNGSDFSMGAHPSFLPTLEVREGADADGFVFAPGIYASVGGSGIQGLHEVAANMQFAGLSFTADAGYQIVGVQAVLKGSYVLVDNGYGSLNVPAALQWDGQNFTATLSLDPAEANLSLGFSIAAGYIEGEDGTAISYGTASATFDSLEFLVAVTPVPEPASALLWAGGAAGLAGLGRWRRRQR